MNNIYLKEKEYLPINNIDELSLLDVLERINGLTIQELQTIKNYEARHKNRADIINTINFRLRIFRENGRFQL